MKRLLFLVLAFCIITSLCACGHQHTWNDATCTEPKTCSECGETEGEPLGHEWKAATCTEPKTCSRCGKTEGDSLGHNVVNATFQKGEYCSVCGETFSDPITSGFDITGKSYQTVDLSSAVNKEYDYTTGINRNITNSNQKVTGTVGANWAVVIDDKIGTSISLDRFYLPAGIKPDIVECPGISNLLKEKDGYEWRCINVHLEFDSQWYLYCLFEDYYTLSQYDENARFQTNTSNPQITEITSQFSVDYNGKKINDCLLVGLAPDDCKSFTVCYRVPKGYDGCVFSLIDSRALLLKENVYTESVNTSGAQYIDVNGTIHGSGDIYFRLR